MSSHFSDFSHFEILCIAVFYLRVVISCLTIGRKVQTKVLIIDKTTRVQAQAACYIQAQSFVQKMPLLQELAAVFHICG